MVEESRLPNTWIQLSSMRGRFRALEINLKATLSGKVLNTLTEALEGLELEENSGNSIQT